MFKKLIINFALVFITVLSIAQEVNVSTLDVIDYKRPKDYVIKDITVSGVKYLDKNILINLSGLTIGQAIEIPGEPVTSALEKLWEQGLFSNVNITATEVVGDSITLNIDLSERNRLSDFKIHGLKKSEKEDIIEALDIKRGKQVTENLFNNTKRIIKDFLIDKKYLNAEIDLVMRDDTASNRTNNVILNIYVDKKEKVKIKEINITGNEQFSSAKLNRLMKKTNKKDWNIFKGSKFIEKDFKEDKSNIISAYYKKGYRDAKIIKDSVYSINNKRIGIYMEIDEGDQYFFRDIKWVGNTKYPARALSAFLKIKSGDPYNPELLNERLNVDQDAVSGLYLDEGYMFSSLTPVVQNIENDSVDLLIRVREGERVTIRNVIIKGNDRTNERVIRREMRTKPGMLFSKSDIIRTQRELMQLGFFDQEQLGVEPINVNQAEKTVDLEYTLVEKSTDQLEVSGGWGANMFVGTLGVRFSNFSLRNMFKADAWRPIPSGDGQNLSVRASTNGRYYSSYSINFVEPWLGGKKPISLSVSAFHSIRKQAKSYFSFEVADKYMKTTGGSIGIGQRLKWPDDFFTISNSISFQRYELKDWGGYFFIKNGTSHNLSFNTTFARNSVDAPIYPRRGCNFSLSLQLTFPYSVFKKDNFWELTDADKLEVKEKLDDEIKHDEHININDEYIGRKYDMAIDDKITSKRYNWIEYHKWKYKGAWYLKLWKDLVLAANTEFGYLGYYNKNLGYAPFGKFELGGSGMSGYSFYGVETIALRGYKDNTVTSRTNGSRDGNVYEKINLELRYPITLKPQATIFVLGFVEAGNTWTSFENYNPFKLKRSAGVGLRAFLPMFGLLGVDWGYGFDNIPGDPGANGGNIHFIIGQQF
ncbi:MAG: outer membrane protein assembly factor BamA [Bacteroidales bacterium]|nr:outer membrane protein assembly factor BamA [Bacteroidales bacterium]